MGDKLIDLLEDFGGFGLMLIGLWVLFTNVRTLAGGALRELIALLQGRGMGGRVIGLLTGALVQSPSAVAGVCASVLAVGRIGRRDALQIFLWSNPGSALLVLLAAFDPRALVSVVFGMLGASFLFGVDKRETPRHAVTALLGVAVLLLGVSALTRDPAGAPALVPVMASAALVETHPAIAFFAGLILSTVLRSTQMVALLTFPLLQAELVGLESVAPLIYGASLRWLTGAHSHASINDRASLMLARTGRTVRLVAIAALCLLYALETMAHVPGVMAAVRAICAEGAVQVALLYLIAQCAIVGVGELAGARLLEAATRRVAALTPAAGFAGETKYLDPSALADPTIALTLAEAEFAHLVRDLPAYLDEVRDERERSAAAVSVDAHHRGCERVAARLDEFLSETLEANPAMAGLERLFRLRARVAALRKIQVALFAFVGALASVPRPVRPPQADSMCESLHAVLQVAADALTAGEDAEAAQMLATLTGDRGTLMDGVRMAILQGLERGSPAQREAMLDATLHFERCLWMLPKVADV